MRLFPLLAAVALAALFIWWFTRTPPEKVAKTLRQGLLWIGGGLLILLAASGRLHWLFALIGAAAPFLQRVMRLLSLLPMLQRLLAMFQSRHTAAGPAAGGKSKVRTRFLLMELDHASGALSGEVLEGPYRGRRLTDLDLNALLDLLRQCRADDEQSAAVLEAYLDREYPNTWRTGDAGDGAGRAPAGGRMSRDEAYEILGLEPGADHAAIIAAHKRLMQRMHPDRGGSTYLAAKINQAKDLLLS
jgi:hypothetical protein